MRRPPRHRTLRTATARAGDPLARVALVFSAGLVGISFAAIFVRLALPAPPVVSAFYRMLFASLALGSWLLLRGRRLELPRRSALAALASGLCFGTDLALWHTAIVHTSVATATLLVNTTPVYVGLYWVLVLRRPLSARFALGAALALAGASLLLGVSWQEVAGPRGAALALAAAVFYSGYLLLMSAARRAGEALPALFLASLGSTLVLLLYTSLGGDPLLGFPASSWLAMLGAAGVSHLGGVMGIVWSLRYLPAPVASVALLGQPLGTALLGWWLLGEALSPLQALGGAAVLLGIVLASQSARRD